MFFILASTCVTLVFLYSVRGETQESARLELLTGKRVTKTNKDLWDEKYAVQSYIHGKGPGTFLQDNHHLIKKGGKVLVVAMGEGQQAVFLAEQGHKVTGVDFSSVAIKKAKYLAKEKEVRVKMITGSISESSFDSEEFDAVICYFYYNPNNIEKIKSWIKKDGLLFYQFISDEVLKGNIKLRFKMPKEFYVNEKKFLQFFEDMKQVKSIPATKKNEFRTSYIFKRTES